MVENRREQILLKALELYMIDGYANVSITDLQVALNIGRGTMYYYFKDKDELFEEVVNTYLLIPKQQALSKVPPTPEIPDMIEAMMGYLNRLKEFLDMVEDKHINTSNVVTVMYTAYSKYPALYKRARRMYEQELNLWTDAIKNSMRAGRIRGNVHIETVARMFLHIKDGWDPGRSGVQMDFNIFPEQYNYLYELIAKEPPRT